MCISHCKLNYNSVLQENSKTEPKPFKAHLIATRSDNHDVLYVCSFVSAWDVSIWQCVYGTKGGETLKKSVPLMLK